MQPYFFPYIGYFQLLNAVDEFIIYDNIQFTKKGWINRNRILVNGKDEYITLPLKKDSDFLDVKDRYLANDWKIEQKKMLNRITESYRKAPFFETTFPLIENIILHNETQLFLFTLNSVETIKNYLGISTPLTISSSLPINHQLKGPDKVIALCKQKQAKTYINAIGGIDLYSKDEFRSHNIDLKFIKTNSITYPQFKYEFIPYLSIIDVLMFNEKEDVKKLLNNYQLV